MINSDYNLILQIAKECGISYAQAKKEIELAVSLGEKIYNSHPREYWKNPLDTKNENNTK